MKLTIIVMSLLALTGCASMYDSQDTCQKTYLVASGEYPSWCGGSGTRYITRDYQTGRPLTTTKAQK
jgi:hypothetical protein